MEFAAGPFTIQEDRMNVVDFTLPFDFDTGAMMIRMPEQHFDIYLFTKPFHATVWLTVAGNNVLFFLCCLFYRS